MNKSNLRSNKKLVFKLAASLALAFAISSIISACAPMTYTVAGVLVRQTTEGLVLQLNNDEILAVGLAQNFKFKTQLFAGDNFSVTIIGQPVGEICTFSPGTSSGKMPKGNVTTVRIECIPRAGPLFTVGGALFGLTTPGLVLSNNAASVLAIQPNQLNYAFTPGLPVGANYNVAVRTQPQGQTCVALNPSGRIVGSDITDAHIRCVNNYAVGGQVTGLNSLCDDTQADPCFSLTLRNTVTDAWNVLATDSFRLTFKKGTTTPTEFTFPAIPDGYEFTVEVETNPTGEVCTVDPGTQGNTLNGGPYNDCEKSRCVRVTCLPASSPLATIGGRIEGLGEGKSVTLINAGDELTAVQSTPPDSQLPFVFAPGLPVGSFYNVQVKTQPDGQTCTVSNGSGEVEGSNVTSIIVTCVDKFTVSGTISGLAQDGLLLRSSKGEVLSRSGGSETFAFTDGFEEGSTFTLEIIAQPDGQRCVFDGNDDLTSISGTINGANVTDVSIACGNNTGPTSKVSVFFLNLPNATLVRLKNLDFYDLGAECSNDPPAACTGSLEFPEDWPVGSHFRVTIESVVPNTLNCTIQNGEGVIQAGNNTTWPTVNCQ